PHAFEDVPRLSSVPNSWSPAFPIANTSECESVPDFSGTGGGPVGVVDGSLAAEKRKLTYRRQMAFMPQSYVSPALCPYRKASPRMRGRVAWQKGGTIQVEMEAPFDGEPNSRRDCRSPLRRSLPLGGIPPGSRRARPGGGSDVQNGGGARRICAGEEDPILCDPRRPVRSSGRDRPLHTSRFPRPACGSGARPGEARHHRKALHRILWRRRGRFPRQCLSKEEDAG